MAASNNFIWKLSRKAVAEAEAAILALASIEPDLAALPTALDTFPIDSKTLDRSTQAWRGLYLSVHVLPRCVVLVGSIDAAPELAGLAEATNELLIVETDTPAISTGELLPRGVQWRSLAEFGSDLNPSDRWKLTTTLVSTLQPAAVLVTGSWAGWEMLAHHGGAIRSHTKLFASVSAAPDLSVSELLSRYLRTCLPELSLLYGPNERALRGIADLFGLSPDERGKLRDLREWQQDDGFLASLRDKS